LPFPFDSPPYPTGEGEGVRQQLRGSLLSTEAKSQRLLSKILLDSHSILAV